MPVRVVAATVVAVFFVLCSAASATPVATSNESYTALGRVFPDPLAGCQRVGADPCSPNAQGNVPAGQFIQYQEFIDALKYMNQRHAWKRYIEVWPLDGYLGDGSGSGLGSDAFPGNNLGKLEFTPKKEYQSAGLATTHARPQALGPDRRARHRRDGARQEQEALRAVAVDPRHRARGRRGRHAGDGGPRDRADGRAGGQAGRAGRRQGRRADVRRRAEEDDHLLHLSEPGRVAARLGHRGRSVLPALQRQRHGRQPRLAGHRLLVPPVQRPVGAREPRRCRRSSET